MKYIDIYSAEKSGNYISQEKINAIQLYFKADLKRLLCCGKPISDGCQITLWDFNIVEMCHNCFIDLFDEVLQITHQDKTKNKKYYSIHFPNYSFQLSNSSLIILRSKLNLYFKSLYKMHIRDDLFLQSKSFYIHKYLEKTRRVVKETEKENNQALRLSAGKRKQYFNKKYITDDISPCYKFEFDISIPKEVKRVEPLFDLKVYTAFSDIPCKTGSHKRFCDAVIVISDGRNYGFTFSFCADHLYDFAMLLKEAYFNSDAGEIVNGDFRLEKGCFGSPCFLTRCRHKVMYKLHINKCSVVLAREGLLLLANKVMTSAPFYELYPIEAKQYETLLQHKEIKESEELSLYYKKLIHENEIKAAEIKKANSVLKTENEELKYKLNHIDEIILQQQNINKIKYEKRIINCLDFNKTDINLGVSAKAAKRYDKPDFTITYINGIKCATFLHYIRNDSIALIETHRLNDAFCLAVCENCADIYLKGLKAARPNKPYINEKMKFSVIVNSALPNTHCYLCGDSTRTEYFIKHGNVKYSLCTDCEKRFVTVLEEIQRKLSHINLLGGKDFISKIKNFK